MQIKANPHMHDGGGLPEPLAAAITSQLAAALEHMHGLGVAHRDVKPENVTHTALYRHTLHPGHHHACMHVCTYGVTRRDV